MSETEKISLWAIGKLVFLMSSLLLNCDIFTPYLWSKQINRDRRNSLVLCKQFNLVCLGRWVCKVVLKVGLLRVVAGVGGPLSEPAVRARHWERPAAQPTVHTIRWAGRGWPRAQARRCRAASCASASLAEGENTSHLALLASVLSYS